MADDKMKNLRAVTAANLVLTSIRRFNKQLEDASELGMDFDKITIAGQKERLKAIGLTSGNRKTNFILVKHINKLIAKSFKRYPHKLLIHKLKSKVLQSFNIAHGGHFGSWERVIQSGIIQSLGTHQIIGQNTVIGEEILELFGKIQNEGEVSCLT